MQALQIRDWVRTHFDFVLLLAAAVEIPRWAVAFTAINEPLWVGVPLGALLAYATSASWKAYFADRRRHVLLAFNVTSLAIAVAVISPVLFDLSSGATTKVDMTSVFGDWRLQATWCALLALTTFVPVVQLAAVKMYTEQRDAMRVTQDSNATVVGVTDAPDAASQGRRTVHGAATVGATSVAPDADTQRTSGDAVQGETMRAERAVDGDAQRDPNSDALHDARHQAALLRTEGLSYQRIAAQLGVSSTTVSRWLRNGNGVGEDVPARRHNGVTA